MLALAGPGGAQGEREARAHQAEGGGGGGPPMARAAQERVRGAARGSEVGHRTSADVAAPRCTPRCTPRQHARQHGHVPDPVALPRAQAEADGGQAADRDEEGEAGPPHRQDRGQGPQAGGGQRAQAASAPSHRLRTNHRLRTSHRLRTPVLCEGMRARCAALPHAGSSPAQKANAIKHKKNGLVH